ncbi:precorrin-6A synthase (deacetylating) [Pelagibacterium lacus]|uniref:Precorrin-6A synthase [deacetylating] n=1 Tax=Pelagibacterium lacus TaxID=2282655 RepID=A0A369W1R9_9HYPH|nr:precorrin-6A synthase (deacetylating) [Pelagibacterium lacus]RDE08313.1 precorrin-6A synthase (deacetylating) [Pelagibacterium lacus]
MRTIFVIGIGTGNPGHMTADGIAALCNADVVFVPTKGEEKARLAAVRRQIIARYGAKPRLVEFALPVRDETVTDYAERVSDWHEAIAGQYRHMIAAMGEGETGALLVWGDPGLYDSTLRILERVAAMGGRFTLRVLPGITAIQALTAAFAIPLNTVGNPVHITTGRLLSRGFPEGADSVVVMLDGRKAYAALDAKDLYIYWAAYVGMDEEILIEGPLAETRDAITAARDAARARHGWVMDIYLLRKTV